MIDDPVGHAVRLDAACVVINLLDVPGPAGPAARLRRGDRAAARRVRPRRDAADGRAARVRPGPVRLRLERRRRPHLRARAPGGRARRRRDQGRPDDDLARLPPRRDGRARAAARARRRPRERPRDPRAHARRARAGRRRDRLRPQRDPARRPRRDDARADGGRARGRHAGAGARRAAHERRPDRDRRRRPDGPRAGGRDRALGGARRITRCGRALEAVCDTSAGGARVVRAHRHACATLTGDRRRLLEDPDIDVLYLAVPHHLHEELYLDAIAAGKDFLGEKPFGIDLAAARADRRGARRDSGRVRALLERDAVLPRRPARLRADPLRRARAADRGAARVPALERPRPQQADQLEAPGALLRRDRRDGRPRHARRAPAAAARLAAAQRLRRAPGHRHGAAGPRRRARPVRHLGQRDAARRRGRLPAHAGDEADRAGRDEHVAPARGRHGRRRRLLDREPEGRPPLRGARRAPAVGAARDRQPVGVRRP